MRPKSSPRSSHDGPGKVGVEAKERDRCGKWGLQVQLDQMQGWPHGQETGRFAGPQTLYPTTKKSRVEYAVQLSTPCFPLTGATKLLLSLSHLLPERQQHIQAATTSTHIQMARTHLMHLRTLFRVTHTETDTHPPGAT